MNKKKYIVPSFKSIPIKMNILQADTADTNIEVGGNPPTDPNKDGSDADSRKWDTSYPSFWDDEE